LWHVGGYPAHSEVYSIQHYDICVSDLWHVGGYPAHSEVYSIQHYDICVSDLWHVGGFLFFSGFFHQ
jgi:hypothetical protein